MAAETEPAKLLLPYLQRADELQNHDPLVAYYCRLYAMERGLKIPQSERTKTTNSLLVSLMKQLEKDKKSLVLGPDDHLHLEGFALNVFAKADKHDRAGRADLNTAKTFYAASIFFEILNQFGELQPDIEEKQKYAVWKAADIRKALKEGRKPTPGPPGDDDLSVQSITPASTLDERSYSSATSHQQESDPTQFRHADDLPSVASPKFHEMSHHQPSAHIPPPAQFHDLANNQNYTNMPPPPASNPAAGHPSQDFNPPPSAGRSENHTYSQQYHHQPYSQEPQQQLQHNYPSHDTYPSNYPNFQSYPSFTESSLPSIPTHYPSFYQGSDSSYAVHSSPQTTSYPSPAQYSPSSGNGTKLDPTPAPAKTFEYDSNYQPPPEKIAEAHKAARFAVGALAFDDVSVAVDFLKKSLELLTNPSANQ